MFSSNWRGIRRTSDSWMWEWHGHRQGGFASAKKAVSNLAKRLDVPCTALRKHNPTKVTKKSEVPGVYWLTSRLGWVARTTGTSMTKAYFTEEEAAKCCVIPQKKSHNGNEQARSGFQYVWRAGDTAVGAAWAYRVTKHKKVFFRSGFPTDLDAVQVVMVHQMSTQLGHPS